MNKTRIIMFRLSAVVILIAVALVMLRIGRGHTIYLDNKTFDYNGQTYSAPYRITVTVDGEEAARLQRRERGEAVCIGQTFTMDLLIRQDQNGEEEQKSVTLPLPYDMDGIIISLPAVLAGLPQEVYLTEFVPIPEEPSEEDEQIPTEEDGMLGDI